MRTSGSGASDGAAGNEAPRASPRERLIQAAMDLVAASGGASVSTRQITDLAGVTAPTLYHHFGDKDGLMEAVIARGFEEFVEREVSIERSEAPLEDVKRLWDVHVQFGVTHPQLYMLMFGSSGPSRRPVVVNEAERLLEAELLRLAAAGHLAVPPVEAARAILAATIGVTLMLIADAPADAEGHDAVAENQLSAQTRDAVLRSILTDPGILDAPTAGAPAGKGGPPSYVAAAIALNATLQSSHPDQLSGTEMKLFLEWLHRLSTAQSPLGEAREPHQGS